MQVTRIIQAYECMQFSAIYAFSKWQGPVSLLLYPDFYLEMNTDIRFQMKIYKSVRRRRRRRKEGLKKIKTRNKKKEVYNN